MLPKYLLVDSSCVLMANYYVLRKTMEEQEITHQILAQQTKNAVFNLKARLGLYKTPTIMVHDFGKSFRYRLYDNYKAGRPSHEHYKSIRSETISLLEESGIIQFGVNSLEADDIAYLICSNISDVWVVSNDNDWKCILRHPAQRFYKYTNPQGWFSTSSNLEQESQFRLILEKILLGCKSDSIPSAIKPKQFKSIPFDSYREDFVYSFLSEYGQSNVAYDAALAVLSEKQVEVEIEVGGLQDQIDLNYSLTFYHWDNYIEYGHYPVLETFTAKFEDIFKQKFNPYPYGLPETYPTI